MKIHISCVVDNDPKFAIQAWNWLLSIKATGSQITPFICYVEGALSDSQRHHFMSLGAKTVQIDRFGEGNAAYCNKIMQLSSQELTNCDWLILSDTDLGFIDKPELLINGHEFRAKKVDFANPKLEDLKYWLELVDEPWHGSFSPEFEPHNETLVHNYNGGLYVINTAQSDLLLLQWEKWARKLIEIAPKDTPWTIHADQVGLAIALHYLNLDVSTFDCDWNFPSHFKKNRIKDYDLVKNCRISAIHYHGHMDNHGLPSLVGLPWIDKNVEQLRSCLTKGRRNRFDNETFWNYRYKYCPELGSGLGSRGDSLILKKSILKDIFKAITSESILDVGCGDLEIIRDNEFIDYTGLDLSKEAISIAKEKRPDWTFIEGGVDQIEKNQYDISLCFDVLIHQPTIELAETLLDNLVRVSKKGIIISIHSNENSNDGISFKTFSLFEYLKAKPSVTAVDSIGEVRDVTILAVTISPADDVNKNDLTFVDLAMGCSLAGSNYPELLTYVQYSREKIGFFPSTVIRMHEYPWFARKMNSVENKSIVDLGAGVCALPFLLADRGASVTTLDSHKTKRNDTPYQQWNEWGYLDYSKLDERIQSHNIDMTEYQPSTKMDIIYSVSVIEHMPAAVRRRAINKIAEWSKQGTILLLSLDLEPDTNFLWNLSEGVIVDEAGHGTLEDITDEITDAGFCVNVDEIVRSMPQSRTDVAYLTCYYQT